MKLVVLNPKNELLEMRCLTPNFRLGNGRSYRGVSLAGAALKLSTYLKFICYSSTFLKLFSYLSTCTYFYSGVIWAYFSIFYLQ